MAANVVIIRDEQEWEVINRVLVELNEGGIIVPPEECKRLDENIPGWEDEVETFIDYDFGGDADVFVDIARNGNFASDAITEDLGRTTNNQ